MMIITGAVLEGMGFERPYARSRPISISDVELREPGHTEVLVKIEAAGVCHSDLSVVNGTRPRPMPMLIGHEAAGVVVSSGAEVTDLPPGQRVVMAFLPRCEACEECATGGLLPCRRGAAANGAGTLLHGSRLLSRDSEEVHHHLGVSGFATHAVVDRASVVPVDADVPPEVAAVFGCAVLTGGGALLNAVRPSQGDTIMVVGLGGVGMAAVMAAVADGRSRVVAVDRIPEKLELARELGADEAHTPEDVTELGVRADHVLECAGHPKAFEMAFLATKPGGRTVTVGLASPSAQAALSPLTFTAEARTVMGSYLGSAVPARDIPRFVDWWRAGRLPVEKLISHRIRLDQINQAMDDLADGRAVRQMITFP